MTNSLRKPTRLTTRIEKATLVAIELLHPNLEHELAPISSRQLLDSVQHSMPNDQVTESELLIAMNKLHQKGHLAELQIQAAPEDGSLVFIVRGSGYAARSQPEAMFSLGGAAATPSAPAATNNRGAGSTRPMGSSTPLRF